MIKIYWNWFFFCRFTILILELILISIGYYGQIKWVCVWGVLSEKLIKSNLGEFRLLLLLILINQDIQFWLSKRRVCLLMFILSSPPSPPKFFCQVTIWIPSYNSFILLSLFSLFILINSNISKRLFSFLFCLSDIDMVD